MSQKLLLPKPGIPLLHLQDWQDCLDLHQRERELSAYGELFVYENLCTYFLS